jgi:hydroxymethylglutaryl-CoA reductase (NADPH)
VLDGYYRSRLLGVCSELFGRRKGRLVVPATSFIDARRGLVPRLVNQGYDAKSVTARREWLEQQTGCHLQNIGSYSIPSEQMKGNVENPVGAVQMPLGVAGPLLINGLHARGFFYVPLATTEGALVRSYERGMVTLTRAGGVSARIHLDENCVAPVFFFNNVVEAHEFARELRDSFEAIRAEAETTTRHGLLLRLEPQVVGRHVMLSFHYNTGDAQGMNMIVNATDRACRWIMCHSLARGYYIFSGMESEKHASGRLLAGGKGKKVTAGALLPAEILKSHLHATPAQFVSLWQHTVVGHLQANTIGYNGHFANGLAALFIACGQDVGNLLNSAVGITNFEVTDDGDLYASVTLPSLTVATVGGGTGLGTSRECLEIVGCPGAGFASKFAEIAAATLLAGELSMGAAIVTGEFVAAHEAYGRKRPQE